MKLVKQTIRDRRLRYLAALLDIRLILVVLFLSFLLFPSRDIPVVKLIDRYLLRMGAALQREPVDARNAYVRVDVPHQDMQLFLHDPASSPALMTFLGQLQTVVFTKGSAIVLHEKLWTEYPSLDLVRRNNHLLATNLSPADAVVLSSITSSMNAFESMLASDRFIRVNVDSAVIPDSFSWLAFSNRLLGKKPDTLYKFSNKNFPNQVPLLGVSSIERPLIWQSEQGVRPEASLGLFFLQQGLRSFEWVPDAGIKFAEQILPASQSGMIVPFFSIESARHPVVSRYELSQLSGQKAIGMLNEKTIVVGEAGDLAADDLLYSVISLQTQHYAIIPAWLPWLHLAVFIVFAVYFLMLPYLRWKVGFVVSALMVASLVLTQQLMLLLHREWLPVGSWLVFLVIGHIVILLWCLRRSFYPVMDSSIADTVVDPVAVPLDKGAGKFFGLNKKSSFVKVQPTFGGDTDGLNALSGGAAGIEATRKLNVPVPAPAAGKRLRQYLGRYQVQRELGRGAMGVVYLGFDPKISRQVAIKTLHYNQFSAEELPAVKERFFREAEAAGRLRHPNIVTIYDAGEEADLAYIAMDYVSGNSLAAYTRKGHLLDVGTVYWLMGQVADAIDYANKQGIVHRDIKPSNILFDENTDVVKVADFGIARIMDASATRTKTGDILGSPLYMSPEQLKGEVVDGRTDIFSLGATFYQLLSGELPFKGDNLANLSYQIVQGKFKPIDEICTDLPDSAKRIINKALQKNPDNRYSEAGEMAEIFQREYERKFSK